MPSERVRLKRKCSTSGSAKAPDRKLMCRSSMPSEHVGLTEAQYVRIHSCAIKPFSIDGWTHRRSR